MTILALPALLAVMAASGVACFLAVCLVQRFVVRESWGVSAAKGLVLGLVAAIPFPFAGTVVGGVLLAWAGAHAAELELRRGAAASQE